MAAIAAARLIIARSQVRSPSPAPTAFPADVVFQKTATPTVDNHGGTVQIVSGFLSAIGRLWARGCLGKGIVIFCVLLVLGMCGSILGGNRTPPPTAPAPTIAAAAAAPTAEPLASPEPTETIDAPTAEVLASLATDAPAPIAAIESPTEAPAAAPAPTAELATEPPQVADSPVPAAAPAQSGAAPQGSDCPADHPVKGNIVDRGANKGEKIYHVPGSSSYKATKPERCFVDVAEAEAAGFRAPK